MRYAVARLSALRSRAESTMDDACLVERRTGSTAIDEETGQIVDTYETVYTGPCRVRVKETVPTEPFAGEVTTAVQARVLSLPVATSGDVGVGHRVTITASRYDPASVGVRYRIAANHNETHATARRFRVEVLTG